MKHKGEITWIRLIYRTYTRPTILQLRFYSSIASLWKCILYYISWGNYGTVQIEFFLKDDDVFMIWCNCIWNRKLYTISITYTIIYRLWCSKKIKRKEKKIYFFFHHRWLNIIWYISRWWSVNVCIQNVSVPDYDHNFFFHQKLVWGFLYPLCCIIYTIMCKTYEIYETPYRRKSMCYL